MVGPNRRHMGYHGPIDRIRMSDIMEPLNESDHPKGRD